MPKIQFQVSPRQQSALHYLLDPAIDELLYGGAKGGGKSVFGCQWSAAQTLKIIEQCQLQPSPTPPIVGFMGRKQSVDFTTTTLETWKRFIPPEMYEIKKQEKLIVIAGTASIRYGGLDDTEMVKKFNSAEFAFFFLDQAEECSIEDVGLLRGTLRLKLNGVQPKPKALYTANPAQCWLKKEFITSPKPGLKFVQALPSDNIFIDAKAYEEQLKRAFGFNPQLLNAYLYGSWDDLENAYTVIPHQAVAKCVDSGYEDPRGEKRITVADIAEDGQDETVIYDFVGPCVMKDTAEIYSHRDLMDTVGRIMAHVRKNKSSLVCVDKVGLGAGVYSRLCEVYSDKVDDDDDDIERVQVYGFDGRIEPPGMLNEQTFRNYKSWAWFQARDVFKEGQIDIPDDETLRYQLTGMTWKFTNGEVIMLDTNEDVKEKLGQSPDRATAVVMGIDALKRASYRKKRDMYDRARRKPKMTLSWATV